MYCIFNENLFSNWNESGVHVRQFREDQDGDRYPILHDNKATIVVDKLNDTFIAYTTIGEVIAVSDTFSTVLSRVQFAQSSAHVTIHYDKETITLERYYELVAPKLYRLIFSNSEEYGELVAVDIYEKGEASKAIVFDRLYDAVDFIAEQQGDDNYYYVARNRQTTAEAFNRPLGLDEYDMTDKEQDYTHLRALVAQIRQKQRENTGESIDIE